MFDLNFKENLKDIVLDEVGDFIDDSIDDISILPDPDSFQDEGPYDRGPLQTDKYEAVIDIINQYSKAKIVKAKQKGESLFTTKSFIAIFAFLVTGVLVQLDNALADGKVTMREGVQMAITVVGGISTVAARGAEGHTGVHTPHFMPGLNKEDFIDENYDGIDDRLQF